MKKIIFSYILILTLVFSMAGCASTKSDTPEDINTSSFDYLSLDVYEYDYPTEFVIGENLSQAIWLYAYNLKIGGNDPDRNTPGWIHDFMQMYIGNSSFNNDYLFSVKRSGNAALTKEQVEYIQYSLTGTYLSFDNMLEHDEYPFEQQEKIIKVQDVELLDSKIEGDTVIVEVNIKTATGGFPATIELQKDPFSCFDGYNILKVSIS